MAKLPKANKELGQHFLKDKSVIAKILADAPDAMDAIVEVGPGPGALTEPLSQLSVPLYLIEMDTRFEEALRLLNPKRIIFQDAMKFQWDEFLREEKLENKKIWLVSNLPYNVSSQLFVQFLQVPQIKAMTLMYQKEVGEKTCHRDGVKNQNNSLLSLSQAFMASRIVAKVAPGAFHPPPKVDSIVVGYTRLANSLVPLESFADYESFLRNLFSFKRKQLGSTLKSWPRGAQLLEKARETGFDTQQRAEGLSFEQTLELYRLYG